MNNTKGLLDRIAEGPVICAEGYLFELERRGYLSAGAYVPEVVLDHPEVVAQLHRDFVHAGSDIVEAFTYYAHREKLRQLGKEELLEQMNRAALQIAKEVARETSTLLAGNICNTNAYIEGDAESRKFVRTMFDEQVGWAVDAGVDFIIAETIDFSGEAMIALEAIKKTNLPAVVTLAIHRNGVTLDGMAPEDACKRLEDAGADVVGLNCARGPETLLPLLGPICEAVACPVAALPVTYRTKQSEPTFQSLRDTACNCIPDDQPFPVALDPFTCNRYEIQEFTRAARDLGVTYFGLCCGAAPHHVRSMAEALGRQPPASRYAPNMAMHSFFGTADVIRKEYQNYKSDL
jgi:betaine-homocysteine S-methyltransferase